MELLDQLETENPPEDPSLAPTDFAEYACIYIKYIQIFKKLEEAYDQMVHPQKHIDMKKALEATMGRILEIKYWLVEKLNHGLDFINLDDILVDLKLTPDVLEIPVPRYFVEDRAKELEDREKFLEALVDKYKVMTADEAPLAQLPPLGEEEAIRCIQVNERGRQGRERARIMRSIKAQQALDIRRDNLGLGGITPEEAAIRIQSLARGFLARQRIHNMSEAELIFIGMKPPPRDPLTDPQLREEGNLVRRKDVQRENRAEYEQALVTIKQKVREMEGQEMRETIQDKVNQWFVENRDPETGEYPEFPDEEDGGSKTILNPPPVVVEEVVAEDPKAAKGKDAGKGKGKDAKGKDAKGGGDEPEEEQEEQIPKHFIAQIEQAVEEFTETWHDKEESGNFFQKYDPELVKDALRPVVFEEVRRDVDEEMRTLLENLKEMVLAEKAAKAGGKKGKKGKGKGKGKKGKGKDKGKKGKGKKDPTADRSMESLYAELVSHGIIQQAPKRKMGDFLGAFNYLGATLEKANIIPDPSMAQVRQAVTEYCILPIGSAAVHEKAPFIKTVLLYGAKGTGKTLLAHAVARSCGANFFNISPPNTDGKYPGKAVSMMMHIVFKVAQTMAPSVIYIDEADKVFLTDKKKIKAIKEETGATEAYNRIKKELLKNMKTLQPGDRVIVIGGASTPFECAKKDEKALIGFFNKHIYCPLPDYASYRTLWPELCLRHEGKMEYEFDLSTLAHVSEGYTSGQINTVCRQMFTKRRIERLPKKPVTVREVLGHLAKMEPVSKEEDKKLRDWTDKLPNRAHLQKPAGEKPKSAGKEKKGKK